MSWLKEPEALQHSIIDFRDPKGPDLLARVRPFHDWLNLRRKYKLWTCSKVLRSSPDSVVSYADEFGLGELSGINFAVQDYLGLTRHPAVRAAAKDVIDAFGPHSGGSPMFAGNSLMSKHLENSITETLEGEACLLYATGWQAGFGVIQALVRHEDYLVIDKLAHACLNCGAIHATPNVRHFSHNDVAHLEKIIKDIRARDTANAILVVTEGLFSMDSDLPPLAEMQDLVHEYRGTLMVDTAHDFGSMGPGGTGSIGGQGMLGKIDLVMGSFSKTFACNGGFVVCPRSAKDHLQVFGNPYTFTNALSPIQCAIADACLSIVRSEEGDTLRANLMTTVNTLRNSFVTNGFKVKGVPSPIVPVLVYEEDIARVMGRLLNEAQLLSNLCEYPAVPRGLSRFRFQVMATHTDEEARRAVNIFTDCHAEAKRIIQGVDANTEDSLSTS